MYLWEEVSSGSSYIIIFNRTFKDFRCEVLLLHSHSIIQIGMDLGMKQ